MFGSKAISQLREEVARLKRMVEDRDLDWVDMRSRCKRLLDRTEKAAKRLSDDVPTEGEQMTGGAVPGADGHLLTPRQRAIQQNILRRRMP